MKSIIDLYIESIPSLWNSQEKHEKRKCFPTQIRLPNNLDIPSGESCI